MNGPSHEPRSCASRACADSLPRFRRLPEPNAIGCCKLPTAVARFEHGSQRARVDHALPRNFAPRLVSSGRGHGAMDAIRRSRTIGVGRRHGDDRPRRIDLCRAANAPSGNSRDRDRDLLVVRTTLALHGIVSYGARHVAAAGSSRHPARLVLDVQVVLTPPCIFH